MFRLPFEYILNVAYSEVVNVKHRLLICVLLLNNELF